MASGSGNTNQSFWSIRLDAWEESYSAADNTSSVRWELYLVANGGSISNRQLTRSVSINGTTVLSETAAVNVASVGSALLGSGSATVAHNADGTKTIACSASISQSGTWTHQIGSASCSFDLELTTIPRASQPSLNTWPQSSPDFVIGDQITVHMNRRSTAFTHTVVLDYGSNHVTIGTNVADNVTYNTSAIASQLKALCTTSAVCTGTITVSTYNGSTLIGTASCAYRASVPASSKPTCSITGITDQNSATAALTGSAERMIKGRSNPRIVISAAHSDATTALTEAVMVVNGTLTRKTISGASDSATFDLTGITVSSVSIYVTDRRGRSSTTVTAPWTLINYVAPTIALQAARSTSNIEKVICSVTGQGWKGNFGSTSNELTVKYYFRLSSASSATTSASESTLTGNNSNAYNANVELAETMNGANEYIVYATVQDKLTTTPVKSAEIKIFQALPSAAFFKTHFDVFGLFHIHDRVDPSVVGSLSAAQMQALAALSSLQIRIAETSITTAAQNGADVTVTFQSPMPDANYYVGITMAGNPNGFDQAAYTVTSRTASALTIHSWNAYSSSITQTLLIIAVHL